MLRAAQRFDRSPCPRSRLHGSTVHTAPRATGRSEDVDQGVQSQAELKAVEQAPCAALPESLLPASIALNNWVDASMDDDLNLFEQMDANYFFLLMFAS